MWEATMSKKPLGSCILAFGHVDRFWSETEGSRFMRWGEYFASLLQLEVWVCTTCTACAYKTVKALSCSY